MLSRMCPRSWGFAGLTAARITLLGLVCGMAACRAQPAICDVCQRDECTALAFRIEYADGGQQVTCCPRCASHAVSEASGRQVVRLVAHDFATGLEVDARTATYVEGSDVEHCKAPAEQRSDESCCMRLAYDRCLPSLIAFGSSDGATAFAREHGGAVRRFEDLSFHD